MSAGRNYGAKVDVSREVRVARRVRAGHTAPDAPAPEPFTYWAAPLEDGTGWMTIADRDDTVWHVSPFAFLQEYYQIEEENDE